jgi:broad specificity phosphatase PhoE
VSAIEDVQTQVLQRRAQIVLKPPLEIYFIRHGETAWSRSGQHTGRSEIALTRHGQAAARGLTSALNTIDFSLVLSSPRLRARTTCALAGLGTQAVIDPDLAEWDYGDYEGLRSCEIRQQRPDWEVWDHGCPNGEMPNDVSTRADRLIARLLDHTGKAVLFSHGHFGRALAARWIGLPVAAGRHFLLEPVSVSVLGFEPGGSKHPVISLWNARATMAR